MAATINDLMQPISSAEFDFSDPVRYDDVESKHRRIAEFLRHAGLDAMLLQHPANFAWFTSGAGGLPPIDDRPAAALFVIPDARVVVTNNVEAALLFDKQLGGLGFQLKQRPWHEERHVLLEDLCRGRRVGADTVTAGTTCVAEGLARMRQTLAPIEQERLRTLGGLVAHAVEATARHVEAGETEADIAGELSHRLLKHEVRPVWVRVAADGRSGPYRHWTASDSPLRRWCLVGAVGSRWGLHCACSRIVVLGAPTPELLTGYHQVALLTATGRYFSQSGWTLAEVWKKVERIYEKQGHPDEWQLADQGEVTGYLPKEALVNPTSAFRLQQGMAIHWHPSIGPMQMSDTCLVGETKTELVTRQDEWPQLCVAVKGTPVMLPDLLIKEAKMAKEE
ncbi:MAG: M24 family metallopeptidase [Planctomycetales bacterium]